MAITISEEVKKAFNAPDSIKILASISQEGIPHAVAKGSLCINEQGQVEYWELLESSTTNRNLIYSLWYEKEVAVTVITGDRRSYQIKALPVKTLVSGKRFEEAYVKAQERREDNDLAAVYLLEPLEVIEESYPVRKAQEEEKHPLYIHLDRLAK